jgi:hypothetical protein
MICSSLFVRGCGLENDRDHHHFCSIHLECGRKRNATPLWIKVLSKRQQIQSAAVVGALQICCSLQSVASFSAACQA